MVTKGASVAVLSAGLSVSGGDRVLVQLTHALSAAGASVTWLVPSGRDRGGVLLSPFLQVTPVRTRSRWLAPFEIAWRSRRYETVIAASPVMALIGNLVHGRRRNVIWFHQGWAPPTGRPRAIVLIRIVEKVLRKTRARTVVVSGPLHRELPHATLLRNGVDLRTFRPRQPRDRVAVIGSILSGGKLHLLPALAEVECAVRAKHPEISLRVLTPEPMRFGSGWTTDGRNTTASQFLQECDLFVSVARLDGFALPPLEAMACGVPVVALPTQGLLGYAQDGENALIAHTGSPEEIADLVARLVASPDLRMRLRNGGLATANQYSLEASEDAYRAYFLGGPFSWVS